MAQQLPPAKQAAPAGQTSQTRLLGLMMGTIFLLLFANLGLFLRMTALQTRVLETLGPFQTLRGLEAGATAPGFSLKDLQDRVISLGDFHEQPILLVFSSTSCPPCREFWPVLQEFHQGHPELGLVMVSRGTREENRRMAKEQAFRFPVLDWDDRLASAYKVPGTPYLYLIAEDRTIQFAGFPDEMDQLAGQLPPGLQ
jgi:peroxiredoxin